ncbi:LysM peptidoglycan-binding domain-containing protein [Dictyobacter formicarum]|uniref:LysM domain-containing protein n=1 Tax=Dictyobacter formicarum TaxID=2778368 RepID=A0ABQ3VBL1_9CHLR|nr:LysM peptidoglycan-binding domain-containing protein [Dictyobacter formicarum]GHO82803.1 hypothetical protein KSZ_08090 [Dictyobacter formicarum]
MSYDPNFPFNNGVPQNNPEPDDDHRTVPMQTNFEAPPAGFPPSDYDTPTIAYGQPVLPAVPPSQGVVQPGTGFKGNMPPATTGGSRKRPNNKTLLIGGISVLVLLLLVIGVLFILPNLTASASNQATDPTSVAVTTPDANATRPANKNIYAPYLARYRSTIRSQIAQGLHMPVDQLVSRLKGGDTLSSIASAQGISSSQLQTIVKTAFQQGFQPAIDSSNLTQKQVSTLINRMLKQPQTLDRYLNVQGRNSARPKGSATPTA